MSDPARTRLRHKRDGMKIDLWLPANAVTYGRVLAALGAMGFEIRAEDNTSGAIGPSTDDARSQGLET